MRHVPARPVRARCERVCCSLAVQERVTTDNFEGGLEGRFKAVTFKLASRGLENDFNGALKDFKKGFKMALKGFQRGFEMVINSDNN